MNNLDVSGTLRTYSEKTAKATTTKQLKKIIRDLREELDPRKVKVINED